MRKRAGRMGQAHLRLGLVGVDLGEVVRGELESEGEELVEGVEDLVVEGLHAVLPRKIRDGLL